jgi:RND family efflux transporter MFP subunit
MSSPLSKKTIAVIALLAALGTGIYFWQTSASPNQANQPEHGNPPRAIPVTIEQVGTQTIDDTATYLGTVRSSQSISLQSQVNGWIERIHINSGARVARGQVLFSLSSAPQQATLSQLKSELATINVELDYQQKELERYTALNDGQAVSDEELERVQRDYDAATSRKKAVNSSIQAQAAQLGYYTIRAPFTGTIGDIPAKIGDYISPGQMLASLTNQQGLEMLIPIPASHSAEVHTGLTVTVLGRNNQPLQQSTINFVEPSINRESQTILAKAPLRPTDNNGHTIFRHDQRNRVEIAWSTDTLPTIPVSAVVRNPDGNSVYLAQPTAEKNTFTAQPQPVTLGGLHNNHYLIESGLDGGEAVIVGGIQKLQPGAKVMELPPPDKGTNNSESQKPQDNH